MFFTFNQNNSGGFWIGSKYVIIEADNAVEANEIATTAEGSPIYFHGVSLGRDCSCCGDRWYPAFENDKGDPVPSIWGEPIENTENTLVIYKPKVVSQDSNKSQTVEEMSPQDSNKIERATKIIEEMSPEERQKLSDWLDTIPDPKEIDLGIGKLTLW